MNETFKTITRHVLFIFTIAIFFAFVALLFGGVDMAMSFLFTTSSIAMMPLGKALTVEECEALAEFNSGLGRYERDVKPITLESVPTWLRDLVEDVTSEALEGSYNSVIEDFISDGGAYTFSVLEERAERHSQQTMDTSETMDADHFMARQAALAQGYEWE